MASTDWARGPYGLDCDKGATARDLRKVLVVVHHLTAATRLADVVPLVERDRRVQVVYTVAPTSVLSGGAAAHLDRLGAVTMPWAQVTQTRFDLAVAAGHGGLEQVHAKVLSLLHGVGPQVLMHRWAGQGLPATRPAGGLRAETIVAGGRVIPSVLALAQDGHREEFARVCPEALPAIVVAGDPRYDRIVASLPLRQAYRRALGVTPAQRLVFVSSTWGPRSLLGRHPDLLLRLAQELHARDHRIVVALHPSTWSWHGRRQVAAWHTDCMRLGVQLLPPEEGWGAALVAADQVIGDYGSVTSYGAALGAPVVLAAFPDDDVLPGSPSAMMGGTASRLELTRPLRAQLDAAARPLCPEQSAVFGARLTSRPGESAAILRRIMYGLLDLPEPAEPAVVERLPLPEALR